MFQQPFEVGNLWSAQLTEDRPEAGRGLGLAQGPSQQGAADTVNVQECLLHSRERGCYLSPAKQRSAGLPGKTVSPPSAAVHPGPCLTRGLCRGSSDARLELGVARVALFPRFGSVHCWGTQWPFCLPSGAPFPST